VRVTTDTFATTSEGAEYAGAADYTQAVRDAYKRLIVEDPRMAEAIRICDGGGLSQRAASKHIGVSARTINVRRAAGLERIASWSGVHPERVAYEVATGAIEEEKQVRFHDVAGLFPLMERSDLVELANDIRANGLIEPIWTHDDQIIDGRNRYLACLEAEVEPRYQQWHGDGSLVAFVLSLNLKRRHLTTAQKAAIATDVLPMLETEARQRQKELAGTRPNSDAPDLPAFVPEGQGDNSPPKGESREKAAELVGVAARYVSDAKRIQQQAPEVFEEMRAGAVTMPQARVLSALPEQKREAVRDAAQEHGWSKGETVEAARELADERIPAWHKEQVLAGEVDPVVVAPNGMFALSTETVGRTMRDAVRNDPLLALENACLALRKFQRFTAEEVVGCMDREARDRHADDLPGHIESLQAVVDGLSASSGRLEVVR